MEWLVLAISFICAVMIFVYSALLHRCNSLATELDALRNRPLSLKIGELAVSVQSCPKCGIIAWPGEMHQCIKYTGYEPLFHWM